MYALRGGVSVAKLSPSAHCRLYFIVYRVYYLGLKHKYLFIGINKIVIIQYVCEGNESLPARGGSRDAGGEE